MEGSNLFEIRRHDFSSGVLSTIADNKYVDGLWPLVYILSDDNAKEVYVGETTDAIARMSSHLKSSVKNKLTEVLFITSDKFNKSATLDIESNLIKYIAGDGQYKLLNGNVGLANHTYYQKNEVYWDIFKTIWSELKTEGISRHTLDEINNSDLFKYSPYKSLSTEQRTSLVEIVRSLLGKDIKNIIVNGGAGTGKTILAIFLFKLLHSSSEDINLKEFGDDENEFVDLVDALRLRYPNPKIALVVPMAGFRATLKKVFKNIKGLSSKMVIGPAEVSKNKFDLIIVDESHRLRKRVNLGAFFGAFDKVNKKLNLDKFTGNELDWVVMQGANNILFYDENQSIKPSDVNKLGFDLLKSKTTTQELFLKSQFRVKGGSGYVDHVNKLLGCKFRVDEDLFKNTDYEFAIFDSIEAMKTAIERKNSEFGLARLVAGYSWKWSSKNKNVHDIEIDGVKLKWNSVNVDFINSKNAINEVGCIHTTQGYDLNYAGVIFGNEISYDKVKNEIVIREENYHDKNGKQSITNPEELKNYIINIYKTILLRGIKGTYIYVCDRDLRDYFKQHVPIYKDSAGMAGFSMTVPMMPRQNMFKLPLFESVGCGDFMYADSTVQEMISVPGRFLSPSAKYFVLKTSGDSMNLAGVSDGDFILCKKNYSPSNGDKVIALLGDDAVLKEFHRYENEIILRPLSSNKDHKDLIFTESDDIKIQGILVRVLKQDEFER